MSDTKQGFIEPIEIETVLVVMRNTLTGKRSLLTIKEPTSATLEVDPGEDEQDYLFGAPRNPRRKSLELKVRIDPEDGKRYDDRMKKIDHFLTIQVEDLDPDHSLSIGTILKRTVRKMIRDMKRS